MTSRILELTERIEALERELAELLTEQKNDVLYRIDHKRVHFQQELQSQHKRLKKNVFVWFWQGEWRNRLSAPIIYSLIVPLLLLDFWLFLYQSLCFPLYRLPKVRRSDYVVLDRHRLGYLNAIEKLNCVYCGYANGLLAYGREIASRTEQYWCPIKHARKLRGVHRRYPKFQDYADGESYHQAVKILRERLRNEESDRG